MPVQSTITTAIVTYTPCTTQHTGKITVTATGSSGFTYNLNGGAYRASNVFSNLSAFTYTVGVKISMDVQRLASANRGYYSQGAIVHPMGTRHPPAATDQGCHIPERATVQQAITAWQWPVSLHTGARSMPPVSPIQWRECLNLPVFTDSSRKTGYHKLDHCRASIYWLNFLQKVSSSIYIRENLQFIYFFDWYMKSYWQKILPAG